MRLLKIGNDVFNLDTFERLTFREAKVLKEGRQPPRVHSGQEVRPPDQDCESISYAAVRFRGREKAVLIRSSDAETLMKELSGGQDIRDFPSIPPERLILD